MGCQAVRSYILREDDRCIVAVGDNDKRRMIFEKLIESGLKEKIISVITPSALVGEEVQVGVGTFIASNAYIGPLARIGSNTIINTASVIEHEVAIGEHSHMAPNTTVCGRTVVGNNVLCGAGSIVLDGLEICDNVVIGAGAVVVENVLVPGTYVGVPAKLVHR